MFYRPFSSRRFLAIYQIAYTPLFDSQLVAFGFSLVPLVVGQTVVVTVVNGDS